MTYEFTLSEDVPEAVRETEEGRAQADWRRRSQAAINAVTLPEKPLRIKGDSEEGRWFVEEAQVIASEMPRQPWDIMWFPVEHVVVDEKVRVLRRVRGRPSSPSYLAELAADDPTAAVEWRRIGRKRRGWRTYAKALRWLREELEPVRDESVYFYDDGREG